MLNGRFWRNAAVTAAVFMTGITLRARGAAYGESTAGAQSPPRGVTVSTALTDQYCVTCHNARQKTANLLLDSLTGDVYSDAPVWEKVVRKLRSGTMPPPGARRPARSEVLSFIDEVESALDRAAADRPNPGRPTLHRLNRAEYTNAVRDLFGLAIDGGDLLPADDSGYGFDNIADVLTVSPSLMERYLSAAQKISRLAVQDATLRPHEQIYKVPLALVQDDQMSEDLPFGSRGGVAIHHQFPVEGEYVVKVRLQRPGQQEVVRGFNDPNHIEFRLDGALIKAFAVGQKPRPAPEAPSQPAQQPRPDPAAVTADSGMEVRFSARAGEHVVGVSFVRQSSEYEGVGPSRLPVNSWGYANAANTNTQSGTIDMGVDTVTVTGPFVRDRGDRSSRAPSWWACEAQNAQCVKPAVMRLARRAYRRPVTESDVSPLLARYEENRRTGGAVAGAQAVVEGLLIDPEFIFRAEHDPRGAQPGTAYAVNDVELASRLSFFLWSSIPDEALLKVAAAGKLSNPAQLEAEVRRMLGDQRADALITNFFGQWLYLRNVRAIRPDVKLFPDFDENLREAFARETELFLQSQLQEDRGLRDLITANYTFVNERLARHYGIPNVEGSHFRRVTLPDDRRAGLLGQGSILSVTSYADRTSPVKRGQWVLQNILGTPPPPPPAVVPPFPEGESTAGLSVRARMEMHRKNPACAACHSQIDPLGFAFENFDAIGKWRAVEAGAPIDPSGKLPSGATFGSPAEFRQALIGQGDAFVRTVIEKLLTYGLGRGLEYYDMPAVREIARESAPDYRWSAVIASIVRSRPFTMRRTQQ